MLKLLSGLVIGFLLFPLVYWPLTTKYFPDWHHGLAGVYTEYLKLWGLH